MFCFCVWPSFMGAVLSVIKVYKEYKTNKQTNKKTQQHNITSAFPPKEASPVCFAHLCLYLHPAAQLFRAPTLWFIELTVATCHIQYTFLSLCHCYSRETGQNTKILEVRRQLLVPQSINTERVSLRARSFGPIPE